MYQAPFPTAFDATPSKSAEQKIAVHRSVASVFKRFLDVIGSLVGLSILALLYVPVVIAIEILAELDTKVIQKLSLFCPFPDEVLL